MILVGDIGGTKTNLAYCSVDGGMLTLRFTATYPSKQHDSFNDIVERFLHAQDVPFTAAAFGVAGPVINGRCDATNLPWVVDAGEIASQLHLRTVGLMNDLEATAYGTLRLPAGETFLLNKAEAKPCGAIAVIAAGTGLGEGGLVWNGSRYQALPSEGGHADFAPRNQLEMDLLAFLLQRYERVSSERVLSGPGLYVLYEFFRSRAQYPEPRWLRIEIDSGDPPAAVSRAGLEARDKASEQALEMFVSLYGAEAGNLALRLLSTGGLYIAGGIAGKILPMIQRGAFLRSYMNKGRLADLLKTIPVAVALNDKTPLYGAAHVTLSIND